MKQLSIILICFLFCTLSYSQTPTPTVNPAQNNIPNLLWAKQAGSRASDVGRRIAVLQDGSSFIAGLLYGDATFGEGEANETTLTYSGSLKPDNFIARYNPDGTLAWAKKAGYTSTSSYYGLDVSALPDGSSLLTGNFVESATFGQGESEETILSTTDYKEMFIARYNPDGTLAWAKQSGGGYYIEHNSSDAHSDGSSIATGYFMRSVTFGEGEINETTLTSLDNFSDVFVARYNSDGTLAWVKPIKGNNEDKGYEIDILSDGSFLVTGQFQNNITFNEGEISEITITSGSIYYNIFIARYNSDGSLAWAKQAVTGTTDDETVSIYVLQDNSFLLTGSFSDRVSAIFGEGESNETSVTSVGLQDFFIAHYNADGTLDWVKSAGGSSNDAGMDADVLSDGSYLAAGYFIDSITFEAGTDNERTLTSNGQYDLFVAKYNTDGTLDWIIQTGGGGSDLAQDIAVLPDDSFFIAGYFYDSVIFGASDTNETTLNTSATYADIFIAKYGAISQGPTPTPTQSATTPTPTPTANPVSNMPNLIWAKQAGGTAAENGARITVLPDGGSLITGFIMGSATFGKGETNETTLNALGNLTDIYIARYNPDGTLDWVKQAGGTDYDYGKDIAVLDDGSSLLAGDFVGSATFGEGENGEQVLSSTGYKDIFIARYDPDGLLEWISSSESYYTEVKSLDILPDGSSIITGYFQQNTTFGKGEVNETTLTSPVLSDTFIARYNSDGTLAWAKSITGTRDNQGFGIDILSDGSFLITGKFQFDITFNEGELSETTISSSGSLYDIYMARYNSDGSLAWAKSAGSINFEDESVSILVLSDDSFLLTGYFQDSAVFGEGETNETTVTSEGLYDIFLAHYNADGTLDWIKNAGGPSYDVGTGLGVLSDGNYLVAGYFNDSVTFEKGTNDETTLTSAGLADLFIAKYNADGSFAWVIPEGGNRMDIAEDIAVFPDDSFILTGYFCETIIFGASDTNETTLNSVGNNDIFIARYGSVSQNPTPTPTRSIPTLTPTITSTPSENQPPTLASAVLAPDPGIEGEPLHASGVGYNDPEGAVPAYSYKWFVNGERIAGETTETLEPIFFTIDDVVTVLVYPYDGELFGEPRSASVRITRSEFKLNIIPEELVVQAGLSGEFAVTIIPEDIRSSSVELSITSAPIRDITMELRPSIINLDPNRPIGIALLSVDTDFLTAVDTHIIAVKGSSSKFTAEVTAELKITIDMFVTLNTGRNTMQVGESIELNGLVAPPINDITVTLTISGDENAVFETRTDSNGRYRALFQSTEEGRIKIGAEVAGIKSRNLYVDIYPNERSLLRLATDATGNEQQGEQVHIYGRLNAFRFGQTSVSLSISQRALIKKGSERYYSSSIKQETQTISVSPNGSFFTTADILINNGQLEIEASWSGDDKNKGVDSPQLSLALGDAKIEESAILIGCPDNLSVPVSCVNTLINLASDTFTDRGISGDKISVLNSSNYGIDEVSAALNVLPDGRSLFLYIAGSGNNEGVKLGDGSILTPAFLAEFLEDASGITVVIIDCSHSGIFTGPLAGSTPEGDSRIIITSTGSGETATFLGNGALSFSGEYFTAVQGSGSIEECFIFARDMMALLGGLFSVQTPQIVSVNADAGSIVFGTAAGTAETDFMPPVILYMDTPQAVYLGESESILANIQEDDFISGTTATITTGSTRYIWQEIMSPFNTSDKHYVYFTKGDEWYQSDPVLYDESGVYSITMLAMDRSGNISQPVSSNVIVISNSDKGDLNGDGNIDYKDLLSFAEQWHLQRTLQGYNNLADFDDNQIIDINDLLLLHNNWH